MTKIINREDVLINDMQTRAINHYADLLKSLPPSETRKAINSGLSNINNYHDLQRYSGGFKSK